MPILFLPVLAASCVAPHLTTPPPVAVTVTVDFGSAARPPLTEQALVPAGASPIEALAGVIEVDQRFVSRTSEDVWSVDGVATDPQAGWFWYWRLNGRDPGAAPDRYALRNGDVVTWTYAQGERPDYR